MENDHGTGSAPPRSPASSASNGDQPIEFLAPLRALSSAAAIEITRHGADVMPFDQVDDYDAEEAEIERTFKARLRDLRRLPRSQRALALRAAREWRQLALQALREKRARDRHTRYMLWRLRLPPPRPPP